MRVEVDGKTVAPRYYTAWSGSTVVALSKEYLDTLSVGKHTLRIVSTDGSADTDFTIISSGPKIGDPDVPALWLALGLLSLAGGLLLGKKALNVR